MNYVSNFELISNEEVVNKIKINSNDSFHEWHRTYYYIDSIYGNDKNDGLTRESAFKTIDRFFEQLKVGENDLRASIIGTDGEPFIIHADVITNCTIHIHAKVPNVKIKIQDSNVSCAVYNAHWNLNSDASDYEMDFIVDNSTNEGRAIYWENASFIARKVNFKCRLVGWGAYYDLGYCTFDNLRLVGCNGEITNWSSANTSQYPCFSFENACNIRLASPISITKPLQAIDYFLQVLDNTILSFDVFPDTYDLSNCNSGLNMRMSQLFTPISTYRALVNIGEPTLSQRYAIISNNSLVGPNSDYSGSHTFDTIPAHSHADYEVLFEFPYTTACDNVQLTIKSNTTNAKYSELVPIACNLTKNGFTLRCINSSDTALTPAFSWLAKGH